MSSHHNITHQTEEEPHNVNRAAKGVPFFTPAQLPPAGTALVLDDQTSVPKLFHPIQIRGLTLPNRITLSPLCQYSAQDGHYTPWHLTHMGGIVQRGPGLSCVEAAGVTANGRITPEDVGLWKDSQKEALRPAVEFAHSQGQKIMIQLAHAGRKASTVAPWLSAGEVAGKELNGWPEDVYAPSAIPWNEDHAMPKEMSLHDIEGFKKAYAEAVQRAVDVGFDAVEIHNAHGYLLHSFLSPVSNQRTDKYGGSFENRTRLTLELVSFPSNPILPNVLQQRLIEVQVEQTRAQIPKDMPLFLRISATDWLEEAKEISESWTSDDTVKLAPMLAARGVDVLDVSSGGNHPLQHPHAKPAYQAPFAIAVKKAVGDKMVVGSVGSIENATLANELLEKEGLDLVTVGRGFQKNPGLVFAWADELKVKFPFPCYVLG